MKISTIERVDMATETVVFWERNFPDLQTGSESAGNIHEYMYRHPGHSHVVFDGNTVKGTALCGHDGKRGFLHHLAADPDQSYRSYISIIHALLKSVIESLLAEGITVCHVFSYRIMDDPSRGSLKKVIRDLRRRSGFRHVTFYFHDIELPIYN